MTDFYQVGGSLKPDAPSYIMRQADETLYEALKRGQFCYVLNSRQMGKSSLWIHTQQQLTGNRVKCAYIDLTNIGKNISEENWYRVLFYELVKSFDMSIKDERKLWWDERKELSPINRLNEFVEDVLLQEINEPLVICLDEIDSVFSLNFSTDAFFAWIRSLYNQRSNKPSYNRLTFCLLGVATISDLIRDKASTSFNIGQDISLFGFSKGEAISLAQGLEGKVSNPQWVLENILEWTGGQPFLTQKICKLIFESRSGLNNVNPETEINVEDFVKSRIILNWESQDNPEHLRSIRNRLLNKASSGRRMLQLYQRILEEGGIPDDSSPDQIQLRLTGLVVQYNRTLSVYNKIYRNVFDEAWVKKELDKIPPYIEQYEGWLNSGLDESRLLSGQDLQEALDWSEDKSLNQEEVRYLKLSQVIQKQNTQKLRQQEAYKIAQGILASEFSDKLQKVLINEILVWTGNQSDLTIIVCKLVIEYKDSLKKGEEREFIEQLIQEHIIENWQQKEAAEHLREMQNRLLATDGDVKARLETYKDILQVRVRADDRPEKLALLQGDLVINNEGDLEVANPIYKQVFNVKWVNEELEKMVAVENQPAPLTSNFSLFTLITFFLMTIVWLVFKPKNVEIPTPSIPEICTKRDFNISLEDNIQKLKNIQNQQADNFPSKCDTQLNELTLIKQAIGLAKNNRVANFSDEEDALEIFCRIPENSSNFNQAKFWVNRWYGDDYWRPEIDKALRENPECNKLIQ